MSKVVGIDLGTTNSLVAYVKDGAPQVIRDKQGDGLVPSVVSFGDDGTVHVGREAQRRLLIDAAAHGLFGEALHGQGRDDVQDEAGIFRFGSAATVVSFASASATRSSRRRRFPPSSCASSSTAPRRSSPSRASSTTKSIAP